MDVCDNNMETWGELRCVNPYDVTPICLPPVSTGADKGEVSSSGAQVKLEMEEFGDLAPYLPAVKTCITDELNTPIFENSEGPFDFVVSEITNQQMNFISTSSNTEEGTCQVIDSGLPIQQQQLNTDFVYQNSEQERISLTQNIQEDSILNNANNINISQDTLNYNNNNDQMEGVVNICDDGYSNVSSPSYNNQGSVAMTTSSYKASPSDNLGIETPDDSCHSTYSEEECVRKFPEFKFKFEPMESGNYLNTPDVIDSVVDLENAFNIFHYISDNVKTTVNVEDIREDPIQEIEIKTRTSNEEEEEQFDAEEEESSDLPPVISPQRSKRKTCRYDDDDEDYVPPTKHVAKQRRNDNKSTQALDFQLGDDHNSKRRSSRTASVSSDYSDASKYRELRDKNNEASRRSRLKRKIKETTLEIEANQLDERNIKLKAQVEQLEKMVGNFRNNLFKIMLKK